MKNVIVLGAAAIRSYKPRLLDAYSPYELVEAVKERYQFKTAPTTEQLTQTPNGPFSFVYDKLISNDRQIIIDHLVFTYVGIVTTSVGASTKTNTNDADTFLDDLSRWMHEEYGLDTSTSFPIYYNSTVEIVLERPLRTGFQRVEQLGNLIASKVQAYGFKCLDFQLSGFSMHIDTTGQLPPYLTPFSIERRAGAAYSDDRYFSQAPLRTDDHRDVLAVLEQVIL